MIQTKGLILGLIEEAMWTSILSHQLGNHLYPGELAFPSSEASIKDELALKDIALHYSLVIA